MAFGRGILKSLDSSKMGMDCITPTAAWGWWEYMSILILIYLKEKKKKKEAFLTQHQPRVSFSYFRSPLSDQAHLQIWPLMGTAVSRLCTAATSEFSTPC